MATTEEKKDYVDLYVDEAQSERDDPNEFISINGKNYLLPKGETSRVPVCVAREYERAKAAKAELRKKSDALASRTRAPINM